MIKVVVLDGYTANPGDISWDVFNDSCCVSVYDWTEQEDVIERAKGATALLTNKVRLDGPLLKQLPDLKYIGAISTGYDSIDIKTAKELGIMVTNVPVYANYSVAQLAFALILELCYRIDLHSKSVIEDKEWCNQRFTSYWLNPLIDLNGKSIGIIGMGKIGERMASIGTAFGMKILAYDVNKRDIPNVTWLELNELLQQSDVVTIHCPLMDSTRGIINKRSLSLMKKTAFFINTSRGLLMVDQDLADALNNGLIAGAGLDVLREEPPKIDNPLFSAKNVIITPHIGWATVDSRKLLILEAAKNLEAFVNNVSRNSVIQ